MKPVNTNKASKRGEDRGGKLGKEDWDEIERIQHDLAEPGEAERTIKKFATKEEPEQTCPFCSLSFKASDSRDYEQMKAYYLLHKHGLSLRAIGAMFGAHQQSVKHYIDKFERLRDVREVVLTARFQGGSHE